MTSQNKQKKQSRGGSVTTKDTPLGEYFAKYHSEFERDPIESAEQEFYRLCDTGKFASKQGKPAGQDAMRGDQKPARERKPRGAGTSRDPIQDFFSDYAPRFQHDLTASSSMEFDRLCDELGWGKEHPERKRAQQKFDDALVLQFNKVYGTNVDDLKNWQNLCRVMRIKPVPSDLDTCRETVRGKFVNLVDLVDAKARGVKVAPFGSERQLREYTLATGKIFPEGNAHAGGVLQHLLQPSFLSYLPMSGPWGVMGRR